MNQKEYLKMRMERRRISRELFERAQKAGCDYPSDLIYLWDFMQGKNIGIRFCLGMIYSLGYLDGKGE